MQRGRMIAAGAVVLAIAVTGVAFAGGPKGTRPNGFSRPMYDVHVPATVDRLSVPRAFLQPNTVYEVEVLALEVSGNQTITVGFFRTAKANRLTSRARSQVPRAEAAPGDSARCDAPGFILI